MSSGALRAGALHKQPSQAARVTLAETNLQTRAHHKKRGPYAQRTLVALRRLNIAKHASVLRCVVKPF